MNAITPYLKTLLGYLINTDANDRLHDSTSLMRDKLTWTLVLYRRWITSQPHEEFYKPLMEVS